MITSFRILTKRIRCREIERDNGSLLCACGTYSFSNPNVIDFNLNISGMQIINNKME